ncbi:MAG TPA: hypothetical protein VJR92_13130 [Gemmatimonadaceae bacterium]|nr:hypothetical protein [Gemmatimonadaceae bacterium]
MPLIAAIGFALATVATDTTIVLAETNRDLTGDGKPELLRLVGVGRTIDELDVTFMITSEGRVLYQMRFVPITRRIGFDATRRMRTAAQHRAHLAEYRTNFFAELKFKSPAGFVEDLRTSAEAHARQIPAVVASDRPPSETRTGNEIWDEISGAPIIVFTFSPGGDRMMALGWSNRGGRFYSLIDCC